MTSFAIVLSYLKSHLSRTILNISLMVFGMMMITILLLFSNQIEQRLNQDSAGIDVVVGAKGSPLQLILSTIWHMDIPTGNISLKEAKQIERNHYVKKAIPLALGDNYRGFRIVGSTSQYLEHFKAKLAAGNIWQNNISGPMQVVLGSKIADETKLKIGDQFVGSHGLVEGGEKHSDHLYQVVGILEPTGAVIDRLILTSLESVWEIHTDHDKKSEVEHKHHAEHEHYKISEDQKEITALLITYKNLGGAMIFPRQINRNTNMQAASPAFEMARLIQLIGFGGNSLLIFALFLISVSLISVLIGLLNSIRERRYDLAIFRIMGASPSRIFSLIIIEGMLISGVGSLIGLILGHLTVEIIGQFSSQGAQIALTGFIFMVEIYLVWLAILLFSFVICLIPAIEAYKSNIRETLSKN